METVLKAISDWIKSFLTAAIMSNLSGLFDDVNTQVGSIAQQVGTKPSSFEPRVFAMIEALSRNVVLPIAGVILTFIACYELIQLITEHNNMAQFEPALLMKWIFKTAISVWIYINKELQRVDVASLNALENKNVITRFPSLSSRCTTVQVLKSPKTDSSIRTIFLPKTVAEMLVEFKAEQDMTKEALGAEYTDYNLVVAGPLGMPTEQSTINGALKRLIEKNNLPKVVFHSFRHSSITYKLKLNGGDIKAVQGDSGHAQASMVTEQYAHILDDDRRLNAQRFDDFFYRHQGAEPEMPHQTAQPIPENSAVDADAAAALAKLLADPSMATLIKNLAKNL